MSHALLVSKECSVLLSSPDLECKANQLVMEWCRSSTTEEGRVVFLSYLSDGNGHSVDLFSVAFALRSDACDILLSMASETGVRRSLSERPSVVKEKGLVGVTLLLTSRLEYTYTVRVRLS